MSPPFWFFARSRNRRCRVAAASGCSPKPAWVPLLFHQLVGILRIKNIVEVKRACIPGIRSSHGPFVCPSELLLSGAKGGPMPRSADDRLGLGWRGDWLRLAASPEKQRGRWLLGCARGDTFSRAAAHHWRREQLVPSSRSKQRSVAVG